MHRVALVLFPGVQVLSLAPLAVFEMANTEVGRPFYDVSVLSEQGGQIGTSIGAVVDTQRFGRQTFDTVMFGGAHVITPSSPKLLAFVQKAARSARRIAGPCTGAFILAEAGILDGRRATTHWFFARDFRSLYPRVTLEEDRIFIIDGPMWTSAGMTASLDLALAMVEKDLGLAIARNVARKMVLFHRRAGGQSQFSALLDLEPKSDRIQSALTYARTHLRTLLSVDQLAEAAHLSPRQFSRAFRAETGQSPAKAIETLRLEAARLMMEEGRHPIEVVARETGFASRERMRRAFLRAYGQPPQAVRRQIGVAA
jgi:transcriptional regulator GlxA family with amidase domain